MTPYSSESFSSVLGTAPAFSNSVPLWTSSVASPPSSRIMFGPLPSGQVSICSVHHQYSGSVSPFQAKTGTPAGASTVPSGPTTAAAAAWSWVEKMLQDDPADVGAERDEGLDQHGGLHGHVQRAGDARAGAAAGSGRTPRAGPSGRASRARRAGSPCGRTRRARGRRPCSHRASAWSCGVSRLGRSVPWSGWAVSPGPAARHAPEGARRRGRRSEGARRGPSGPTHQ